MSGNHLSREFFELIKNIGESKSKQEEDRIVRSEVATLKAKLDPNFIKKNALGKTVMMSKKKQKEYLVRLMYVEMLGHDGSFGYIKAVEMVAGASVAQKRLGYLVCGICLPPEHEFRFMLINQLQRDLQSSHVLETASALIALSNLATVDMIAAVSNFVIQALDHGSDMIRKKAVHALYKCYQKDPSVVTKEELVTKLRKILCDRDPGVMGASLCVIEALTRVTPIPFKDLVPSLVSILKQIIEQRLPREYDYHRMPAPWMQMSILRILRILGKADMQSSQGMYEIVGECMKKADIGINAGYAVVYECIRTITNIYPNVGLLDAAAEAISRFISSRNNNLKYLGVTGLAAIVEAHPKYATAHQLAVMDCLESTDITLAHRTLELLYRMTNPHNVEFIIEKLILFLRGGKQYHSDEHLQRSLTFKIANLAERFAPSNEWYVDTITQLLEISGNIPSCSKGLNKVGNQLMQLIAEGDGSDEDEEFDDSAELSLRRSTVNTYVSILLSSNKPILQYPDVFIQIMSWILGEYGYLADTMTVEGILERMCELVSKKNSSAIGGSHEANLSSKTTTRYLFNAVFKLIAQAGTCSPKASKLIEQFKLSHDVELQQRCIEFEALLVDGGHLLGDVLPIDASCEDLGDDVELRFLDDFVQEKINLGAAPYSPPDEDEDDLITDNSQTKPSFNMTPYAKPTVSNISATTASRVYNPESGNASSTSAEPNGSQQNAQFSRPSGSQNSLRKPVPNVWGKAGASTSANSNGSMNPTANTFGNSTTSNNRSSNPYGGAPPTVGGVGIVVEEEKPRELTEREKMASALFGGVGTSAAPTSSRASRRAKTSGAASTTQKKLPSSPQSAPAVAAEPAIDLLDMTSFGDSLPATTATSDNNMPNNDIDFFASQPDISVSQTADFVSPVQAAPEEVTAPVPAPSLDPFAAEGLLGGLEDKPLPSLGGIGSQPSSQIFNFNGKELTPLSMSTPEFGQLWASATDLRFLTSVSIPNAKATTLDDFMKSMVSAGFHLVEAIQATDEGICSGIVDDVTILVHGKIGKGSGGMTTNHIDLAFKTSDGNIGSIFKTFFTKSLSI